MIACEAVNFMLKPAQARVTTCRSLVLRAVTDCKMLECLGRPGSSSWPGWSILAEAGPRSVKTETSLGKHSGFPGNACNDVWS
mmetsp:Transcript_80008/g.141187  ORF Transcript_80008/g.141187 Transcript_80008/m.141187 type:complete len:83 (-) Transcript_80008:243-491(-)